MGEACINNHPLIPGSAMLGLYNDEPDPGLVGFKTLLHNLRIVQKILVAKALPFGQNW